MKGVRAYIISLVTNLQLLNDISVVFGGSQARVSSRSVFSWQSPVQDALLNDIIGLDKQVVHLAVKVHWDGNGSTLGWAEGRSSLASCFISKSTTFELIQKWALLTHIWEHFNTSLYWGFLKRGQPVTVIHPKYPLQQLHKNWLTSLVSGKNTTKQHRKIEVKME